MPSQAQKEMADRMRGVEQAVSEALANLENVASRADLMVIASVAYDVGYANGRRAGVNDARRAVETALGWVSRGKY